MNFGSSMQEQMVNSDKIARPLEGVVLTTSALSTDKKMEIYAAVEALGGQYSIHMTQGTTHLSTVTTATEKYRASVSMGDIFIVSPDWPLECLKARLRLPEVEFPVLPFSGLKVSVTGFPAKRRAQLVTLIQENGGDYGGMLVKGATHLIAEAPKGPKYETAMEWGDCLVVQDKWVDKCVEVGRRVMENDFFLSPLQPQGALSREGRAVTHAGLQFGKDARSVESVSLIKSKLVRRSPSTSFLEQGDEVPLTDCAPMATADILRERIATLHESDALADCRILLLGWPAEEAKLLCWMVLLGHGTRHAYLNELITHVVLGDCSSVDPRFLTAIEIHPNQPSLVGYRWLVNSVMEKKKLDAMLFPVPRRIIEKRNHHSGGNSSKTNTNSIRRWPSGIRRSEGNTSPSFMSGTLVLMSGTGLSSEDSTALGRSVENCGGKVLDGFAFSENDNRDSCDLMSFVGGGVTCYVVWAHGCSNVTSGHPEGLSGDMLSRLYSVAGIVEHVSVTWLRAVLSVGVILPLSDCRWFRPMAYYPCRVPSDVCGRFSLCLSNFTWGEKVGLCCLAREIGLEVTQNLTQSNTHLICGSPTGPKYIAAKKWGLKIVLASWLFDCALEGYMIGSEKSHALREGGSTTTTSTTSGEDGHNNVNHSNRNEKQHEAADNDNVEPKHEMDKLVAVKASVDDMGESQSSEAVTEKMPGDSGEEENEPDSFAPTQFTQPGGGVLETTLLHDLVHPDSGPGVNRGGRQGLGGRRGKKRHRTNVFDIVAIDSSGQADRISRSELELKGVNAFRDGSLGGGIDYSNGDDMHQDIGGGQGLIGLSQVQESQVVDYGAASIPPISRGDRQWLASSSNRWINDNGRDSWGG